MHITGVQYTTQKGTLAFPAKLFNCQIDWSQVGAYHTDNRDNKGANTMIHHTYPYAWTD